MCFLVFKGLYHFEKLHPSTRVGIIRAILSKYRISVIDIWLNGLVCSEDWSLVCVQKGLFSLFEGNDLRNPDIPTAVAHSLGCIVPPVSLLLDAVTKWKQGTVTITLWWFEVEHSSIIFPWKELANVADQEYESRYKIGSSAFHLQQIFFSRIIDKSRLFISYRTCCFNEKVGYGPEMITCYTYK